MPFFAYRTVRTQSALITNYCIRKILIPRTSSLLECSPFHRIYFPLIREWPLRPSCSGRYAEYMRRHRSVGQGRIQSPKNTFFCLSWSLSRDAEQQSNVCVNKHLYGDTLSAYNPIISRHIAFQFLDCLFHVLFLISDNFISPLCSNLNIIYRNDP